MNIKVILAGALLAGSVTAHAYQYRSDNGISDDALGLSTGGEIAWWQQFSVSGGNSVITAIELAFGTTAGGTGLTANMPFDVYVWQGTPTGTGVDTPTLLATTAATLNAGSINTDIFQSVAVNASITGTSNFFIGASMNHGTGVFPASLQMTDPAPGGWPILDNSWVGAYATNGFNPNNFGVLNTDFFKNSAVGFSGNWLIRAQASPVPEPATMATLAAALGALALRRRKRS